MHHKCKKTLFTLLFYYFVRPLLFFTTAAILPGMLSMRLQQYPDVIFWVHTIFVAVFDDSVLVGCWSATSFFITCHKFMIGFRSGLFPVQSKISTLFCCRKLFSDFSLWHGAPSGIKTLQSCTIMWISDLSLDRSWYFAPFMVVFGSRKYRPVITCADIAPSPDQNAWEVFNGLDGVAVFIYGVN